MRWLFTISTSYLFTIVHEVVVPILSSLQMVCCVWCLLRDVFIFLGYNCLEHLIDMKYVRSLPTSKSLYCCSLQKDPKKEQGGNQCRNCTFQPAASILNLYFVYLFKLWWIIYLTDIGHLNMDAQLWIFEHKYNMNTRYDTY